MHNTCFMCVLTAAAGVSPLNCLCVCFRRFPLFVQVGEYQGAYKVGCCVCMWGGAFCSHSILWLVVFHTSSSIRNTSHGLFMNRTS